MKSLLLVLGLSITLLCSCHGENESTMSHQFPTEISLKFGIADSDRLWVFASKTPLYDPGKPIQMDSEYVCYQLDSSARLLRESVLGIGALRAVDMDGGEGLALIVGGLQSGNPKSTLYLTIDSGKSWMAAKVLPGAAVGAAFFGQHKVGVWTEKQVFLTEDGGRSWSEIQSSAVQLDFNRVKVPVAISATSGVPLVGIEYNSDSRKTCSRLGVLSTNGQFAERLRVDGQVIDMSRDGKGTLWLLVLEESEKPKTKLLAVDNLLGDVRSRVVREIPGSIPKGVSVIGDTVLFLYAKWVVGSRMPLVAETGASTALKDEVTWRVVDFEGLKPNEVFFDLNKGVWLYTKADNRLSYQKWRD
ncbi:MAG: hypothetical protein KBC32_07815 [Candidatus Didemnitutus sp.]|nr:hypothetical protein [Candidatus Didemnitutus sp.]